MHYKSILYLFMALVLPRVFAQEEVPTTTNEQIINSDDTDRIVNARLATYTNCSKNGNNPKFIATESKDIQGNKLCYTKRYVCEEKGNSGKSTVEQVISRCFNLDEIISDYEKRTSGGGNGGSGGNCPDGNCNNGGNNGGGGGGIIITDGYDFCHQGSGCGPCASKCKKYFEKGKSRNKCVKCLEKNGYYCLASLILGNKSSCSQSGVRYTCSNCSHGDDSGDSVEYDCTVVSKKHCEGGGKNNGGGGGGKNDDCPECNRKPYPPGTGFLNVMTGLGNFIQGAGAGFGMSGLSGVLGIRECRKWYTDYNQKRVETDNPLVDWDCQKFAGAGGVVGGGGVIPPYGIPPYGGGGYGYNPGFPGNFQGPYGNYNPYGGLLGGLGGLLGGGISGNINFGGNLGGGLGSPYTQPWFGQGANGLPYNPYGPQSGVGWFNYPNAGGIYGGGYGGGVYNGGGAANGGYFNGGNGGGVYNGGYGPQGSNSYYNDRMIQEQARRDTGMRYFIPQPLNSSWQYMYPR